jgi:hypothetical protein
MPEQYMKIWHDILSKSDVPKELINGFFIKDKIDPIKFKENHDHYVMDRYGGHKPTPSCFYWFLSAYPDVVKYFAYLPDNEIKRFMYGLGITGQDLAESNCPKLFEQDTSGMSCFKSPILYEMKEHYKKLYPKTRLECSVTELS